MSPFKAFVLNKAAESYSDAAEVFQQHYSQPREVLQARSTKQKLGDQFTLVKHWAISTFWDRLYRL